MFLMKQFGDTDSSFYHLAQTVNPSTVDVDAEDSNNVSQTSQSQMQDPLYSYLDPALAGTGLGPGDTSLGGGGIPLSSSDPLASIPQTHQLASSMPQGVPASSLDVEHAVKQEPAPSPISFTEDTSVASKSSKMPTKTTARGGKRRLSTTVNQSVEPVSDTQRRSTRQKIGRA